MDSNGLSWENAVIWLRNQPSQRQLVLNAFYDDPLISAADRYFQSSEWQEVARLLRGRTGAALDVGAGRGIASYALARDGFKVTALEPDPRSFPNDFRSATARSMLSSPGLCCTIHAISTLPAPRCIACFVRVASLLLRAST
jgi:SAM-dependent methyltransferase